MRRVSQRSHLVTLNEINITPLLDLAFVLLIIFIITTPLLEQGMDLSLPHESGRPDTKVSPNDIVTVEVDVAGQYMINKRIAPLDQVELALREKFAKNKNMVVYIRADENGPYKHVAAILQRCDRNGISRISLRTDPRPGKR
ncbi:MAG: ExbD/TolR family protein [Verrucomicrobiota bacterium]